MVVSSVRSRSQIACNASPVTLSRRLSGKASSHPGYRACSSSSSATASDHVALLRDEVAAGEIAHQALVDGCSLEGEVIGILGERQFGDGYLISDRARLLLRYLGLEQVADEALWCVLALDRRGQCLVVTGAVCDRHVPQRQGIRREDGGGRSRVALRQMPEAATPTAMLGLIERLEHLQGIGIAPSRGHLVHHARLAQLAREAGRTTVQHIADYERPRRHATLVAISLDLSASLTDQAVDLFDRLVGAMFRKAKGRHARAFQADARAINEKVRLYARVGAALIAARDDKQDAYNAIIALIPWEKFRRQRDNQGHMTALVPAAWADTEPTDQSADQADIGLMARALAGLEDAIAALRERLERSEAGRNAERARADDLRAQIGVLSAEMVVMRAEAERALAEERQRAGRLSEQVEALSAEVMRVERAEADRDAERARADALRDRIEALQEQLAARHEGVDATEAIRQAEAMVDSLREAHTGEISALKTERHRLATQIDGFATRADQAEARADSLRARVDVLQRERDAARAEAQDAAEALRQAEAARKARGLLARLRAAWRGE